MKETFELFLTEKLMQERPIFDDDLPDALYDWAAELDAETMIKYAQQWGDEQVQKETERMLKIWNK